MPPNEEARFLATYSPQSYERPAVTVDLVIFTVRDADLKILAIKRSEHPYQGAWALPGGFVRVGGTETKGENLDEAAHRVLAEETGLPIGSAYLEQLYTYGDVDRDPRMRVISVAWFALLSPELAPLVTAGRDAAAVKWHSVATLPQTFAFDHEKILQDGLKRVQGKLDYSSIAFDLVPDTFTISDLRGVHEAILGNACDAGNFRRRFLRMVEDGLVEKAPGRRITTGKPAAVFRFIRAK